MIRKIKVHGYRSLSDITIECSNMTFLTGCHLAGKTAVIEALFLNAQAQSGEGLNGTFVSEPGFYSVHNRRAEDRKIRIEVTDDNGRSETAEFYGSNSLVRSQSLFNCRTYIHIPSGQADFGIKGRPAAQLCAAEGHSRPVMWIRDAMGVLPEDLVDSGSEHTETLVGQASLWLEKIAGMVLVLEDLHCANRYGVDGSAYTLMHAVNGKAEPAGRVNPGILNAAGIIIACLSAPEGTVICIENPENGLSPDAQSEFSRFLYFIADSGRQVFIETHSDHIFNAVRAGLCTGKMDPEKIAVNYLALDGEHNTCCNPVRINKYGDLSGMNDSMTLDGFFDRYSRDLDIMLGL